MIFFFQAEDGIRDRSPSRGLGDVYKRQISICRERREYTPMMDITDKESYRSLYSELKQYEKRGIDILMDGYQVSPMQIVTAYMAKEEGAYMRDYVMDQNGRLESLTFTDVDLSLIHISEPTRRTPISYAVFCLKKKKQKTTTALPTCQMNTD